ncbi:MAG: acireductone synthase [Cyanobium sp.]|nr:acireductone synthase [Cyanobium sp.]
MPPASEEGRSPSEGISHLLLDIEGTTCPVDFVAGTLFPYAADRLETFLEEKAGLEPVRSLIRDVHNAWVQDDDDEARTLRCRVEDPAAVAAYLRLLIRQDRKLTALKELQGLIWEDGYACGELTAPLFEDVANALRTWQAAGMVLAVYSSGSVKAQQLLYGHSSGGDLRHLFCYWFDTRTGPKQQSQSYRDIAAAMTVAPESILFISDALAECEAAHNSGMAVLFSDRAGNPHRDPGPFKAIRNYNELLFEL